MSVRTYSPPVFSTPIDLDLSRNEGRPPPGSPEQWGELVRCYPDLEELGTAISMRHQVSPSRVLVTAGSDDALFRCLLAHRGGKAVSTTPTFEMISVYSRQTGVALTEVEWSSGSFPTKAFAAACSDADIAIVVSPNNPTGAVIGAEELVTMAAAVPRLVLDGAYEEFADSDLTEVALTLPNVVILRTFSKAMGMAGARVGYALGSAESIKELGGFGSPYPVAGLSAYLAAKTLANGGPDSAFVSEVKGERDELTRDLIALGAEVLPSQANFVTASGPDPDWVVPAAASLGIGVRSFPRRKGLESSIRITLPGRRPDFDRLQSTIRAIIRPEAILFDLDGVIADVRASYDRAILTTAARFGVTLTTRDVEAARAPGNANDDWELTRRLCADVGVSLSSSQIVDEFERVYQGTESEPGLKSFEVPLVDRIVLENWAARIPLALVTGRPRKDALEYLEREHISDVFNAVVSRDDGPRKPDPAPVKLALERLGVNFAWMLGDTVDDLMAARGAGVVPIAVVAPGVSRAMRRATLAGAARVLSVVTDLEVMLDAQRI